jgi:phospholipase/carboxylesterase
LPKISRTWVVARARIPGPHSPRPGGSRQSEPSTPNGGKPHRDKRTPLLSSTPERVQDEGDFAASHAALDKLLEQLHVDDEPAVPDSETNEDLSPPAPSPGRKSDPSPSSLPPPIIMKPSAAPHSATIIFLPGFTTTAKSYAEGYLPKLAAQLPAAALARFRLVFLNAPHRKISCYGQPRPKMPAWHDYYTDHGGRDGRPEVEEEIDAAQLEWTRWQVHAILDSEVARLGGEADRVVLYGESQGGCCAIDCALTYPKRLGGVFLAISQLYSHTPISEFAHRAMRIVTFNGAADATIGCSLALRTYARLIDAGFHQMRMHIQPGLTHCGATKEEVALLAEVLCTWGLLHARSTKDAPARTV